MMWKILILALVFGSLGCDSVLAAMNSERSFFMSSKAENDMFLSLTSEKASRSSVLRMISSKSRSSWLVDAFSGTSGTSSGTPLV